MSNVARFTPDNIFSTGLTLQSGVPLVAGVDRGALIPCNCEIVEWYLLADVSSTISLRLRLNSATGTILTASAPLTLTAAASANSSTLTGWTTLLSKGARLYFDLVSNDNAKQLDIDILLRPR